MKDNVMGSFFGLLAFTVFGFVNIFNKYILATTHINTWHISYWRGLTMCLFNIIACLYFRISIFDIKREHSLTLFFRTFFGGAGQVLNTLQFGLLSLSKAQAMYYTYPIWTAIIGWLFLKERLNKYDIFSIVSAFTGVLILILNRNPNQQGAFKIESPYGVPVALVATFFISLGDVCSRKIGSHISHYVSPAYLGIAIAAMTSVLMLIVDPSAQAIQDYSLKNVGILGAICVLSWMFIVLITKAYQLEKAARVAVMVYIQIVFSTTVDVVYFGNTLGAVDAVGIVLIMAGNFLILVLKCMNVIDACNYLRILI
eukprot:TRINITY_DN9839_c0_g2_i5.p1 TRINITY_DN9839_c0_g2~~TRINITY_DN9839_c0_g2_i5.p1  ORF type:complete len:313 (-),score=39.93 TRINITY_DN9839_c0_g2_i5:93-1031(-)